MDMTFLTPLLPEHCSPRERLFLKQAPTKHGNKQLKWHLPSKTTSLPKDLSSETCPEGHNHYSHVAGLLTEQQPSRHRASPGHKQPAGARKAISPQHLTTHVPSALLSCTDTRTKASLHPSNDWQQLHKILQAKAAPADAQRSPPQGTRAYAAASGEASCLCGACSGGLLCITSQPQQESFSSPYPCTSVPFPKFQKAKEGKAKSPEKPRNKEEHPEGGRKEFQEWEREKYQSPHRNKTKVLQHRSSNKARLTKERQTTRKTEQSKTKTRNTRVQHMNSRQHHGKARKPNTGKQAHCPATGIH